MISVMLVDDHLMVLEGLRYLIGTQRDMKVVGHYTDSSKSCEAVRRLRPDVLVVDMKMSPMSGVEVIRQVALEVPSTRIVVVSMHDETPYVWRALAAGAVAYVLKSAGRDQLLQAVRSAASGKRFLCQQLNEEQVAMYGQRMLGANVELVETLTRRERQVLSLAAEGLPNASIAAMLEIGVRTVESHRASLMRKLELKNQTELVRFAIVKGIITAN